MRSLPSHIHPEAWNPNQESDEMPLLSREMKHLTFGDVIESIGFAKDFDSDAAITVSLRFACLDGCSQKSL